MPAILVRVLYLLTTLWTSLKAALPWLGKIGPWIMATFPALTSVLQKIMSWFGADTVETLLKGAAAMAVRGMVLTAWAVFLAVVLNGIYGFNLREIVMHNPFSGIAGGVMFLVAKCFPVKFFLAISTSYIIWKFTVLQAAILMEKIIKGLFGG